MTDTVQTPDTTNDQANAVVTFAALDEILLRAFRTFAENVQARFQELAGIMGDLVSNVERLGELSKLVVQLAEKVDALEKRNGSKWP